jgi:pyrroline-5-carboxylate reductase
MVSEGMIGICKNSFARDDELDMVKDMFRGVGRVEVVLESQMDAVVAVSGSSPAYVYIMIEAMADAAVLEGIPRDKAYTFAAQAVYGSAKMVLESGIHPADLKDKVCSPGGTTIEAVKVLEDKGFRGCIIEAMEACANKSRNM